MDSKSWLVPATLAVIIMIPILTFFGYIVREQLLARRNRTYKTLADHQALNAGDREAWMSGIVPQQGDEAVDRFSSRIVPIAQLATLAALVAIVLVWNNALVAENARQEERLAQIELQIHALALSAPAQGTAQPESASGLPPQANVVATASPNPMQQACANLIGRVADAYEKGESSKIGQSLEELVKKLGCQNNPTQ